MTILIALALLSGTIVPAAALDWDATVAAGISLPGGAEATDDLETESFSYDLDKPLAPLIKAAVDLYPLPWLGGGIFAFYGWAPLEKEINLGNWDGSDHVIPASGISLVVIGGCVKGRLDATERLFVKPAIGWSYLQTFSESPDARMRGFVVTASCEAGYPLPNGLSAVAELGLAAQPYGGVKDIAYVTFGPIFYLVVGITL